VTGYLWGYGMQLGEVGMCVIRSWGARVGCC
jgi:hypothetical protein